MSEPIEHTHLGDTEFSRLRALVHLIKKGDVTVAGNRKAKIYGTLSCKSGKRLKVENRVFFTSEEEARQAGYRPCAHCLRLAYRRWRLGE